MMLFLSTRIEKRKRLAKRSIFCALPCGFTLAPEVEMPGSSRVCKKAGSPLCGSIESILVRLLFFSDMWKLDGKNKKI
jgi:hypothetical protein